MALALIYIFATAKPFSIRRLTALFVSALLIATPFLEIVHVRNVRNDALTIAALLTLLVWITPLLRALRDTVRYRSLSLDALRPVSAFVLWTYGFALTAAPITAASEALNPTRRLHLGVLLQVLAIASFVALLLRTGSHSPRCARLLRQVRIHGGFSKPFATSDDRRLWRLEPATTCCSPKSAEKIPSSWGRRPSTPTAEYGQAPSNAQHRDWPERSRGLGDSLKR
jgi:hypothetical protein